MSGKWIGFLILLVVSEILGLFTGHWFFGLYARSIPQALTASVSMQGTRLVFLLHGAGLGLVIYLLVLAAVGFGRLLGRSGRNDGTTSA